MSTRAGGSPGLINRSMCNFSLTFTVVDCQFEHCIGKTIQRVKVWTVCEGFFFGGGGVKVSHTQNTDKNMYIRDFNFM